MIDSINSLNSSAAVNFRAKMDVSACKSYKPFWGKVAKSFEKQTSKHTGRLVMQDLPSYRQELALKFYGQGRIASTGFIYADENAFMLMSNETPAKVAKKIAKVYRLAKPVAEKETELLDNLYILANKPRYKKAAASDWEAFAKKHYYNAVEKMEKGLNKKLAANDSTKGFEVTV